MLLYRTIIDNFDKGRLNPFWVPVVEDNINAHVKLDIDNKEIAIYSNAAITDSAFIRSVVAICGDYILDIRFKIVASSGNPTIFNSFIGSLSPIPSTAANQVSNNRKFIVFWETATPRINIGYYDGSHVFTSLTTVNAILDTWYRLRISKKGSNYEAHIFKDDWTNLSSKVSIALSSVFDTINPDYIIHGDIVNDAESINMNTSQTILTFDSDRNNYSNSIYYSNSFILGRGLG